VSGKFVVSRSSELNAFDFGLHLSSGRPGVLHDRLVDDVIYDAVDVLPLKVAPRYVTEPAGKPTRLARPTVLVCTNTNRCRNYTYYYYYYYYFFTIGSKDPEG